MFASPTAKTKAKTASATVPTHAPKAAPHTPGRPAGGLVERVALLQRTIGNRATLRLLAQRGSRSSGTGPDDRHEQAGRAMHTSEPQLGRENERLLTERAQPDH